MDNTKRVWYRVMDGENIVGYMFKAGQTCEYEERVVAVIAFPELYSEVSVVVDNGAEYLNVKGGFHQDITIQQVSSIRGFDVYTGETLINLVNTVSQKNHRYAVHDLYNQLQDYQPGKIYLIKGIRRTGKTTVMLHTIATLIGSGVKDTDIGYITITPATVTKSHLINLMASNNWQYLFVDGITAVPDIIDSMKWMADVLAKMKRVILAGMDSYVWSIAVKDVLYGRTTSIDLTHISLEEYCSLFDVDMENTSAVIEFMNFGGVMDKNESVQVSIVGNIVSTIERNKIITAPHVGDLAKATREQLNEEMRTLLSLSSKPVAHATVRALKDLQIFSTISNCATDSNDWKVTNPIMYICHVNALTKSHAFENMILAQCSHFVQQWCQDSRESGIHDTMTMNFCRYELTDAYMATSGESNRTPEVDIVLTVRDFTQKQKLRLVIELKVDDKSDSRQRKNLDVASMRVVLGQVDKFMVVYLGETKQVNNVQYIHAYDFLMNMPLWLSS